MWFFNRRRNRESPPRARSALVHFCHPVYFRNQTIGEHHDAQGGEMTYIAGRLSPTFNWEIFRDSVDIRNGVATIWGTLPEEEQRHLAERIARALNEEGK